MRVKGHRLIDRGAPYTGATCQKWPCTVHAGVQRVNRAGDMKAQGVAGHGHALCQCGWTGTHVLSGADRKRDHVKHKADILDRQPRRPNAA